MNVNVYVSEVYLLRSGCICSNSRGDLYYLIDFYLFVFSPYQIPPERTRVVDCVLEVCALYLFFVVVVVKYLKNLHDKHSQEHISTILR